MAASVPPAPWRCNRPAPLASPTVRGRRPGRPAHRADGGHRRLPDPRRVPLVRIGDPAADLDDEAARAIGGRSFKSRYAVVYVTDGPRVRLGVGWALLVAATLVFPAARTAGLAGLFGIAAGWAAYQIVAAWDEPQSRVARWVAAAGPASLSLASMAGVRGTGAALLLLVAAALVVGVLRRPTGEAVTSTAGKLVIRAGLPGSRRPGWCSPGAMRSAP